jgi:type II secretion system protein J
MRTLTTAANRRRRADHFGCRDCARSGIAIVDKSTPIRQPRAFTIIEVMLAMAILALIVTAVYTSWAAIMRGAESGRKAAASAQRSRIALRTLQDALTSARSFAADSEYYGFVAENGDEASLSFVARLPESFPRSGRFGSFDVRRVTFSLEPGPDSTRQLVMRQNPLLMDMDIDEKEHPIILETGVKAFGLEFWDLSQNDWTDEWAQTNQLPALVRVTLSLGGDTLKSHVPSQVITRIIALPAMAVPAGWQTPGPQGAGGPPPPPINAR